MHTHMHDPRWESVFPLQQQQMSVGCSFRVRGCFSACCVPCAMCQTEKLWNTCSHTHTQCFDFPNCLWEVSSHVENWQTNAAMWHFIIYCFLFPFESSGTLICCGKFWWPHFSVFQWSPAVLTYTATPGGSTPVQPVWSAPPLQQLEEEVVMVMRLCCSHTLPFYCLIKVICDKTAFRRANMMTCLLLLWCQWKYEGRKR